MAVGGIAFDDSGRVLLVQRGRPPNVGRWSIPGGRIELGETMQEALIREMREETGLTVEVDEIAEVVDRIGRIGRIERIGREGGIESAKPGAPDADDISYHFVIIDFLVTVISGTLRPADDVSDARWLSRDQLERLPLTEGLIPVLERAWRQCQP